SCRRRSAKRSRKAAAPAATTATTRPTQASQASSVPHPTPANATPANSAAAAGTNLIDNRVAKRNRNRVRPRVRLELREDVAHVALDGLLADKKLRGDVRVRHPVGEELEDLPLPPGEHLVARIAEEGRHQGRVDEAVARDDLVDRLQQCLMWSLLEDV